MKRRDFLRLAAATPLAAFAPTATAAPAAHPDSARVLSRLVPGSNIRDYLASEARRISDATLGDCRDAASWRRTRPGRLRRYLDMMGLLDLPELRDRPPLNPTITGVVERGSYRIEKLHFEPVPGWFMPANLYIPAKASGPAPGVLYVCGHAANQKVHYQAHARRFAELGFVCLLVETIETVEFGETRGTHHGPYREGWFHWYSRGFTSAGVELLAGIRALDLLAQRPEVDAARLGVTGISGGGAASWWIAAADERVKVAAPVCGTATLYSHVHDRTIDGHCDCMWWVNTHRWDMPDIGGLIAPRPLLIASADRDGIFTIESIREVHARLTRLYRSLGASDHLRLVETPGGHSYHERSRTAIFSWFARHLQGREIPGDKIGDIDDSAVRQESPETLRVFVNGPPSGNRTRTIQDDLRPRSAPPVIASRSELESLRKRVVAELRGKTFGAFPAKPPRLDTQVDFEFDEDGHLSRRLEFNSEDGWRLPGTTWLRHGTPTPAPAVIVLRSPGEGRWDSRSFAMRINAPWLKVELATRGTGDTAWGNDLDWHVRRAAAWTGRTVASMRVWDTLRAMAAVRALPGVDPQRIALAARGEMAAVALYAALLDGNVGTLILENPPATQDAPGPKDGSGPALEMLNCLRVTDLPQVAGLLFPAHVVVAGDCPASYEWASDLCHRLGDAGRFRRVKQMTEWQGS